MVRNVFTAAAIATALVVSAALSTLAQDEPASPEGVEWRLIGYRSGNELVAVPETVQASLLLEDGVAGGSTGCNGFSGSYTIDAAALTIDDIAATETACVGDHEPVEQGYLVHLPDTATWSLLDGLLELADDQGSVILTYEGTPDDSTATDIAVLSALLDAQQTEIESLKERLGNVRIGALRDRISELEDEVATLRRQLQSLRSNGSSNQATRFNPAERILLEGIPGPIRRTCTPRRSENPIGAIAAVQCKPATPVVRDMAYYLMTGAAATNVFEQRMRQNGVSDGAGQCRTGDASLAYDTPGPAAIGCYVNADGRANLRIVGPASGCHQLRVGDRTLRIPAIYIAVLGSDDDIRSVARWAEPRAGRSALTQEIKRPNAPISPRCPS